MTFVCALVRVFLFLFVVVNAVRELMHMVWFCCVLCALQWIQFMHPSVFGVSVFNLYQHLHTNIQHMYLQCIYVRYYTRNRA